MESDTRSATRVKEEEDPVSQVRLDVSVSLSPPRSGIQCPSLTEEEEGWGV